jgi:hypothetical protein
MNRSDLAHLLWISTQPDLQRYRDKHKDTHDFYRMGFMALYP